MTLPNQELGREGDPGLVPRPELSTSSGKDFVTVPFLWASNHLISALVVKSVF